MYGNHFDDPINGCPGGQFIQPPAFAWWTIFSCLRWPVFSVIFRIPYYLLILPFFILVFCVCLIGVITSCACLPLTLPISLCIHKNILPCSEPVVPPITPGFVVVGFIAAAITFVFELIWLPVPIVLSIFQFPLFLCTYDPDHASILDYFACFVHGNPNPYWCFPLSFGTSILSSVFHEDD